MKNLESNPQAVPHRITAFCVIASVLAACAALTAPVPPALDPGSGQRPLMQLVADGDQIYECRAAGAGAEWTFVAPEASLIDGRGRPAGQHGAGPSWTAADGSRVVGSVEGRADAPDAGAIPWLLLRTRSTGGPGVFEQVTSIQRLNTVGGVAPSGGCSPATLGAQARVPYRAHYRLFTPTGNARAGALGELRGLARVHRTAQG